jgi:phage-related protein
MVRKLRPVASRRASFAAAPTTPALKLACIFFRTEAGSEPVRNWLKDEIPAEARKVIGADIKTVQATWPIGKPLVAAFGQGLWEIRSTHNKVEYRVIFTIDRSTMILLHGFTKATRKTRKADIDTALGRKAIREKSR